MNFDSTGGILWTMIMFFFWMMLIWMFIAIFADIFRRNDISGGKKALWIIFIFVLPFLGILIYIIARPKMTEQDKEIMMKAQEAQRRAQGYSAADEIEKLQKLKDSGAITAEEFEAQKKAALVAV
jgi:ABC-type multidrug transport system fused ATPase/permease subunit